MYAYIMNGLLLCVGPRLCDTFWGDDKGSFMVHVRYEVKGENLRM